MNTVLTRILRRLHRDERGNIGILLLLVLLALVGVLAVVWNGGEYATRRQHVQTAADTAAQSAELWMARTNNAVSAANMMICQNGSAEVMLRSIQPTSNSVGQRLLSEYNRSLQLLQGNQPASAERNIPDAEYFQELLGFGPWASRGKGDQLLWQLPGLDKDLKRLFKIVEPLITNAGQVAQIKQQIDQRPRRNAVALDWLIGVWVGGAQPRDKNQLPPAVKGGLLGLVGPWVSGQVIPRLEDLLNNIAPQQRFLDQFIARTQPAFGIVNDVFLAQRREEMLTYEQTVAQLAPAAAEEQRARLADFYKCNITYATPAQQGPPTGPATINPPLQIAANVIGQMHQDGIRPRYPVQAEARFGTADPTLFIDGINVHVDNSAIWHPGVPIQAPPMVYAGDQIYDQFYNIGGGQWGGLLCAPLARYFNERVWRDAQGLRPDLIAIDDIRSALRGRVFPPPVPPLLPPLPSAVADTLKNSSAIPLPPDQLPKLPTPAGLKPAELAEIQDLNKRIDQFNKDVREYIDRLRDLYTQLDSAYHHLYDLANSATHRFADGTWLGNVNHNRAELLYQLGQEKRFLVLQTYALRPIPEWARPGMWTSAREYIYRDVYNRHIGGTTTSARNRIENWAYKILQPLYLADLKKNGMAPAQAQQVANQRARAEARQLGSQFGPAVAQYVVDRGADFIAREVADEWIRRPWPYEITPPPDPQPMPRGILTQERLPWFTMLASAQTTSETSPRPMLPVWFPAPQTSMTAYAQSEHFNWMEFNGNYGARDGFDRVSAYGGDVVGGSPAPWRLSTIGGWSWNPRLAWSDGLGPALENNPEFRTFFDGAGVKSNDTTGLQNVPLH